MRVAYPAMTAATMSAMFWKRVKNTMLAACSAPSPTSRLSAEATPHAMPGTVPHSSATVYSATTGPTTETGMPE